jgi:hypothetical protein
MQLVMRILGIMLLCISLCAGLGACGGAEEERPVVGQGEVEREGVAGDQGAQGLQVPDEQRMSEQELSRTLEQERVGQRDLGQPMEEERVGELGRDGVEEEQTAPGTGQSLGGPPPSGQTGQ